MEDESRKLLSEIRISRTDVICQEDFVEQEENGPRDGDWEPTFQKQGDQEETMKDISNLEAVSL